MQNPKVADLLSKVNSNPMAIMGAMSDPELAPIFQRLVQKLGPQLSSMLGGLGGLSEEAGELSTLGYVLVTSECGSLLVFCLNNSVRAAFKRPFEHIKLAIKIGTHYPAVDYKALGC